MWFSLSSQVISDPECAGLQRSVCQGDAIAGIIPACPLGFPSDKVVHPPYPRRSRTHHDRWGEVVRRREPPFLVYGDHGVIARMIVTV